MATIYGGFEMAKRAFTLTGDPALVERLKEFCRKDGRFLSKFMIDASIEKLDRMKERDGLLEKTQN
jgi:hypothetical protein